VRAWRSLPPALLALTAQAVSFSLAVGLLHALNFIQDSGALPQAHWVALDPLLLLLLQSMASYALTAMLRLDPWWKYLNAVLPGIVFGLLKVQVAPGAYLIAFVVGALVFSNTLVGRVPYFPTNRRTWVGIASLLDKEQELKVIDIGSGLGGLNLWLESKCPKLQSFGVEIAPIPWLISVIRAKLLGASCKFMLGNYHKQYLGKYDVVIAYLSPAAMPGVWQKAKTEIQPGGLLISHEFAVPDVVPSEVHDMSGTGVKTYVYRF